jgi:transcriptional regulator with XRE-family HTH domain
LRNPALSQPRSVEREKTLKRLGANLRRERTARRISQEKLAVIAQLNARTIARIEAGELSIRPETIERLRRAIGCPPGTLLPNDTCNHDGMGLSLTAEKTSQFKPRSKR